MKYNFKKLVVVGLIAVLVLGLCACGKKDNKSSKGGDIFKEEPKTNCWEEKDGKQYYYGDDGEIMKGRFVLEDEQKIYYTDEDGAVMRTVDGKKPMVALTYDDGPSKFTMDFVKLFNEYESAATFYEVGERIDMFDFGEAEQAISDSYCELGSHTYSHKNIRNLTVEGMKKQLSKNDKILREYGATGDPITFRAPEGAVGDKKETIDRAIILWSVDTEDWRYRDAKKVYKKATKEIKDGDIILMHSLYESTYEASTKIVPELIDQGFQLVTMQDLAEFRGGTQPGEVIFEMPPLVEETTEDAAEESAEETTEATNEEEQ